MAEEEAADLVAHTTESPTPETFLVRWMPGADIFKTGGRPQLVLAELASLGDCSVEMVSQAVSYNFV